MSASSAQRLEAGEILRFAPCPFLLPQGDDLAFLVRQRLQLPLAKYVQCDVATGQIHGLATPASTNRLAKILSTFSLQVRSWLARLVPAYFPGCKPDRVTWRTEEEATRRLGQTKRNDLLHVDVFPDRPTHGARILRLFVNLHPTDPRVWATSHTFETLLTLYGHKVRLRSSGGLQRLWHEGLLGLFTSAPRGSDYDRFLLRLHQYLKNCDEFQEKAPRRLLRFQPGEAWLAFTDGISHAELRGQFALEHSFFVPPDVLTAPERAPVNLVQKASGTPSTARAA